MKTNYTASMDTVSKIITLLIIVLVIGIFVFSIFPKLAEFTHTTRFWESLFGYLMSIFVMMACYVLRIIRYEITPAELSIIRPFNPIHIPLNTIKGITKISREDLIVTIRIGNGGFFGYTGFYWNRAFGWMRFYMTQRKNIILIELTPKEGKKSGIKFLISPDDAAMESNIIELLKTMNKVY